MVGRKSWSPAAVGEKLRLRTELAILWSSYCVLSCDSGVSALISRILNKWQLLHPPPPNPPTHPPQSSTFPWLAVSKAIFTRRLAHIHAVEPPKYTQALARIGVQGSAATLFSVTHSCTHTNPCAHWVKATKKNKKRHHNVRLKATCTVRMRRSWFAHKNQRRGQNFKNKNATNLKCTCGRERLKDGDRLCLCVWGRGLCLKGLLPWVTS